MVESPALKRSATPTVPLKLYAGLKKKGKKLSLQKAQVFILVGQHQQAIPQ